MKMNKKILFSIVALSLVLSSGCNDDFLDRYPETNVTEANFFKTSSDLELYSNQFYRYFESIRYDYPSDNICTPTTNDELFQVMSGGILPSNATQWNWTDIRNVNFMIARSGNVSGEETAHFVGLARMVRAYLYYYDKVLRYSNVPWYSRDLQTTDEDLLYKTQDSRSLVVDSVMADLNFAVVNMKSNTDRTLFSKEVALALLARIALSEASWRKYHAELELNDADKYYQIAIAACEELMRSGSFSLNIDYAANFRNNDLKGNPEMIMYQDFNYGDPNRVWWNQSWEGHGMLSRDLMETYLYIDGDKAKPFTSVEGYNEMSFDEFYKNRDSRLEATFWTPGYVCTNWTSPRIPNLIYGGYGIKKYGGVPTSQNGYAASAICWSDLPIFRYAEILLIYAEAKAELGILTQTDLDNTINLLRDRAKVPRATLADWEANVDPVLLKKYPNVLSSQKAAILEVRRERRVELADEGFRYDDLMRWSCGDYFSQIQAGIYFPDFGLYDLNADNVPDVLIVATNADKEKYADEIAQYGILSYVIEDGQVALTEGTKGCIKPAGKDNVFTFESPKHYYYPISEQDMVINSNLTQISFWK